MKRNCFYLVAIGLGLTVATACNNEAKVEDNTDTVVIEKNTTTTVRENTTTQQPTTAKPSTSVTVGAGGAAVSTKSTDVSVSKDSVTFKSR